MLDVSPRDVLTQRLRDAELDGSIRKVLYSSINTLSKKGRVYMLGFNPGGDPARETQTLAEHIGDSPQSLNEYLDAAISAATPAGGCKLTMRFYTSSDAVAVFGKPASTLGSSPRNGYGINDGARLDKLRCNAE
jgi:hypothetical protein